MYKLIELVYIDSSRKDEVNNVETLLVDIKKISCCFFNSVFNNTGFISYHTFDCDIFDTMCKNKDSNCFVYTAVFYFVLFFVTQIMDYFTDITEEKCYADSYVNLVRLISHKISFRNYRNSDLSLEEINQLTGQEFEKANKYFGYISKMVNIF